MKPIEEMLGRIEAMLDMMTALMKLGVKHQNYDIRVSHDEFAHWITDQVVMTDMRAEYDPESRSVYIYGPSGLGVIVSALPELRKVANECEELQLMLIDVMHESKP